MGLFIQRANNIREKVENLFDDTKNYVVAVQHRSVLKQLGVLLLGYIIFSTDSARIFLLYFDPKGIYESEISFSDKSQFLLMPWHEISDFKFKDKGNKVILSYSHLGQQRGYEIAFDGNIMKDNRENTLSLIQNNWNRI